MMDLPFADVIPNVRQIIDDMKILMVKCLHLYPVLNVIVEFLF